MLADTYELDEDQLRRFVVNILCGGALKFYQKHVRTRARSYPQAKRLIAAQFNGPARQARAKTFIQGLRFDQFPADGTSPNDALAKLSSTIKRTFPKKPKAWQCEFNKIEALENAVADQVWAINPIERLHIELADYESFFVALANGLQKSLRQQHRHGGPSPKSSSDAAGLGDILYKAVSNPLYFVRLRFRVIGTIGAFFSFSSLYINRFVTPNSIKVCTQSFSSRAQRSKRIYACDLLREPCASVISVS